MINNSLLCSKVHESCPFDDFIHPVCRCTNQCVGISIVIRIPCTIHGVTEIGIIFISICLPPRLGILKTCSS